MSYKLVCVDMDGTLLNTKHKVSTASREALKKAHDKGVHIVVSTGRMYTDAEAYSRLIGTKSAVIASNGAYIRENNEIIYKSFFSEEVCLKLFQIFLRYNVSPMFYTPERIYYGNLMFKIFSDYLKLRGYINKAVKYKWIGNEKQWKSVFRLEEGNIVKCELINTDVNKLKRVREELEKLKEIQVASSSKNNIEINCHGISKGTAVERLAAHYNINRKEIIAIGDSENDLSMIEFAGMGIAMGNAIDLVKEKADYITETNSNDGVAKAIDKFINSNEDRI
ncbi:HAD family phosphatase [Clostridium sp. 19966]|uniref:Cof-type HAD-IIB family hydrolase n=1 Tax=Clostridium sp. 19966 TaxID=2768166 RepID=UPI0028DEF77D|nr:Cof-type HAD-IIB family hydrolase [Clostridium sp. 19966]MDT8715962.1 HAD family phosphatase [Clostridium sp. 19966]